MRLNLFSSVFLACGLSIASAQYSAKTSEISLDKNGTEINSESVDFKRIPNKKVVKLLQDFKIETKEDLAQLSTSCYTKSQLEYSSTSKSFLIDGNINEVWDAYKRMSPTEDDKNKVRFNLLYSANSDKVYYLKDSYEGMKEGEVVFWNLKFLMGLIKVPVGQKVMDVDDENKYFKICYLTQGKTQGSQYIQLYPTEDGKTQVIHYTVYRSDSSFRDKKLYPGFHNKAITEYHESVMSLLEEEQNKKDL